MTAQIPTLNRSNQRPYTKTKDVTLCPNYPNGSKIMSKVGDLLGINYLGTHTLRKTGAYRVYTQSNYNIGLVMHLLNHSSEAMTLAYLGLDQASTENMLNQIDFG